MMHRLATRTLVATLPRWRPLALLFCSPLIPFSSLASAPSSLVKSLSLSLSLSLSNLLLFAFEALDFAFKFHE
ncbi:hypothetical protein Scep_030671 [Stephania cephalantha]|uniref:Uncharacterized protein n=1 Tax=Stephania cephalantha TaxID=152367 RepID=A0AAP0E2W8_9MAGN